MVAIRTMQVRPPSQRSKPTSRYREEKVETVTEPEPSRIAIGIVGAGRVVNRHHAKNLRRLPGVDLVAVSDLNAKAVGQVIDGTQARGYVDYLEMLANESLDAVLICTPPSVRLEPVTAAAERGIAVFVEKPPALDVSRAREVGDVIARSGVINAVGFMYRYSKAVGRLRELIAGERVSLVRSILLCGPALNPDHPAWFFRKEVSGGPILDQAIHMLDLSRYLLGDVEALQAFGSNVIRPKSADFSVEDSVSINLSYLSGTVHNHTHSWAYPDVLIQLEVISDRMHLWLDLPGGVRGRIGGEAVDYRPEVDEFYLQELQTFTHAVRLGDQSVVRSPYSDAIGTLEAVLAANDSVETGASIRVATVDRGALEGTTR